MRRFALPLLLLPVLLALGVAAAPARAPRTYASSCGHLRYRPHAIVLTCADAGFQLRHLHWRRWGSARAFGRGRALVNDCDPFCAAGHFHRYRIRVLLGSVVRCHGHRMFHRARIHFVRRRPAALPAVEHWRFACI